MIVPPLSLYIHLPWCARKCPYCDFNSHVTPLLDDSLQRRYIQAVLADLDTVPATVTARKVRSIFIGGGTPSLFFPAAIEQLLAGLTSRLSIATAAEITMEANPGSADSQHFRAFRNLGVNRLSLGIQSFNDRHLEKLGRIHGRSEACAAIDRVRATGFDNFNLDIMYGLPQQDIREVLQDIEMAVSFSPPHLSWYQLTLEPNTVFWSTPPPLPEHDILWEMQLQGARRLQEVLEAYEISSWAKKDYQCWHNRNYWEFGDYLGLGAGAHSKLSDPCGRVYRQVRYRIPQRYMSQANEGNAVSRVWDLQNNDRILEFFMNALRLYNGVTLESFQQRTGVTADVISSRLEQLHRKGLLQWNGSSSGRILPTDKGSRFLNTTLQAFI